MNETYIANGVEWYSDGDLGGGPVWPARLCRQRDDYDRRVQEILSDLARLEMETRPAGGAESAKEKDLKAQQALHLAGNLVGYVAGWAIDHVAGLAKSNLDPLPYEREEMRVDDYLSDRAIRDNHDHERLGNIERLVLSRDEARRLLVNLVSLNPGAFPPSLQCDVIQAFLRIARGDQDEMFALARNGSRFNAEKTDLQLQIIAIIAYRKTLNGTPKERSIDDIVALFQISDSEAVTSAETIKSWEPRLRQRFGDKRVEQYIRTGEIAARNVLASRKERAAGFVTHDEDTYSLHVNDSALRAYVEQYSRLPRK
jgi:hypothetical protein